MTTPIKSRSIISTRTISAVAESSSIGGHFVKIVEAHRAPYSISLNQDGVDALSLQLLSNVRTDHGVINAESLAKMRSYSNEDLRYRAKTSLEALSIRKVQDENRRIADEAYVAKVAAEVKAKAEATLAAEEAAKLQAILNRRPAPGAYKLTTLSGLLPGHTIVTEDRSIYVEITAPRNHNPKHLDRTENADRVDTWTFTKVPLTPALVNDAFPLVDDLTTWLQLATK